MSKPKLRLTDRGAGVLSILILTVVMIAGYIQMVRYGL